MGGNKQDRISREGPSVIDDILSRLSKVKPAGNGKWTACCPAHDDRSPSLSVKECDDGKILIKCWAGCQTEEIMKSIGMKMIDLAPPSLKGQCRDASKQKHSAREIERCKDILMICEETRKAGDRLTPREMEMERVAWEKLRA